MTDKGRGALIDLEGCKLKTYLDSAGLPTIGVGHLLTKDEITSGKVQAGSVEIDIRKGITKKQSMLLLECDIEPVARTVDTFVHVALEEHQRDALISFAFNIGRRAFRDSTLLRKLNAGDFNSVPAQMKRWIYSAGKVVEGLINRRGAEIRMWRGEL